MNRITYILSFISIYVYISRHHGTTIAPLSKNCQITTYFKKCVTKGDARSSLPLSPAQMWVRGKIKTSEALP